MTEPTTNAADAFHGDTSGSPPAHGATSASHGDTSSTTTSSLEELQRQLAELQRTNAEVLADNQKYRKKQKEQEQAALAAEEARLYEQGEFRALAEKHENRVKELEPISESYAALSAQVNKQINADIKDWPDEVKSLDPGKEASVETRLAWVAKARSIVEKMTEQQANRANARGASPSPRPQGAGGDIPPEDLVKAMRGSGKYGL